MPPEIMALLRTTPRTVARDAVRQLPAGEQRTQLARNGVEAAGVDEAGAGSRGRGVVGQVHPVDELGLSGEIQVVGPGGGARGDERFAVVQVEPDGGHHDTG